jgi:RimJ/RimL family protein N-acetyltransferase
MNLKMDEAMALLLNTPFSTPRLAMEPINGGHADVLFGPLQNEKIYDLISAVPPKSIEQLKDWYSKCESRLSPEGDEAWLNWAVRRLSDGSYIGKLDACIDTAKVATNVGYLFFPQYWGEGYASEAVLALSEHLIAHGVSKMIAVVTFGNAPSYRVLEKAGFVRSRVIPDNDTIRGVKYDDVEFIRFAV